jgi:hypothetical protein
MDLRFILKHTRDGTPFLPGTVVTSGSPPVPVLSPVATPSRPLPPVRFFCSWSQAEGAFDTLALQGH